MRATVDELEREAKAVAQGHTWEHSGTELGLKGFTDVRFGMDRRLHEVEQMLSASKVVVVKLKDRPELRYAFSDYAMLHTYAGFPASMTKRQRTNRLHTLLPSERSHLLLVEGHTRLGLCRQS